MVQISEQIFKIGIIPVIAIDDADKAVPLACALVKGDLPAAEVTFRTAAGEKAIRRIAAEVPVLVGAALCSTWSSATAPWPQAPEFIVSPAVTRPWWPARRRAYWSSPAVSTPPT